MRLIRLLHWPYGCELRHLGTARTGAHYSLAPFIGAVLSVVLPHDSISLRLFVAATLMAVGLWLHLSEWHEHEHTHAPQEHERKHIHDERPARKISNRLTLKKTLRVA